MGVSYVRSHVGTGTRNLHAGWPPWTGHGAEDEPGFGRFPGGPTCLLIPLINSQRAHGDAERGYVTRHAEAGDPGLATEPLHRKNISANVSRKYQRTGERGSRWPCLNRNRGYRTAIWWDRKYSCREGVYHKISGQRGNHGGSGFNLSGGVDNVYVVGRTASGPSRESAVSLLSYLTLAMARGAESPRFTTDW